MDRRADTYSRLISAAIFIVLEVAAFGMLRGTGGVQDRWISRASHRTMGWLWGASNDIAHYFSLKKENERLIEENFRLHTRLEAIAYEDASKESEEQCDGLGGYGSFRFTAARVVKMSTNSQHNYIVLDKGSEEGIVPNSGIISSDGVIGVVGAVSRHHCYGITLLNSGLSVSSRLGKNGPVGPLRWNGWGTGSADLREIPLHIAVEPGEVVYTSGFSAIYPPDLPLGTVRSLKKSDGTSQTAMVDLFQDFTTLRNVIIVTNLAQEEISELENGRD